MGMWDKIEFVLLRLQQHIYTAEDIVYAASCKVLSLYVLGATYSLLRNIRGHGFYEKLCNI